jgi:ketosteroid isomerase-like protein
MSEENVELVRNGFDAYNAFIRDEGSIAALAETLDPQIEWHWHDRRTYPDAPQHLRGVPASIGFWEQWRGAWAEVVAEPLELIEATDGLVLAFIRQTGRGRQSGVPIVIHYFQVLTIRDGKTRKFEFFRHRTDALEAAGLSE